MALMLTEYRAAATTFRSAAAMTAAIIEACADGKTACIARPSREGVGYFEVEVFDISALWSSRWLVES